MSRSSVPTVTAFVAANNRQDRGFVRVENDKGSLRLRFSYAGKRHALAVGLPDSSVNRIVAQQKAAQIELDIISGNFDPTLKKYKPPKISASQAKASQVVGMFEKFTRVQAKAKKLEDGSLRRYSAVLSNLKRFFPAQPADRVDSALAEKFLEDLRNRVCERTVHDYLTLVNSCWKWAEETLPDNPWPLLLEQVKPAPKQKVKPFTAEEVQMILEGFKTDRYYQHYTDFVAFLFGTGCRFGESVALQWKHLADDFSTVWIGDSVSRGVRKTTKTGKDRTVMLTGKMAKMLIDRRPSQWESDDLVFPAPRGKTITDQSFRRRAWKKVLEKLEIEYRKPYSTRHTAISHALANGANPLEVAEQTGHDPQILFKHYASVIQRSAVMVEF
ncbi:MAG: tyrosine-type recombinase/integrase [Cyanothece sp. SIO1E1]|nr:tyrosine-type recombinase/integrase [Cyanothece sp. SIO1E1]